ncbi:tyrosine-type recombinase/integrase [Aliiglaciecola sp. 3_MG-2023]|uniref:tyrosine-type recombinase/integrase n=1 Tax=Aliiglaciecola sp. 3_MG-2023 TaxID=3062644 RepID=UPI0026E22585|nr:tyrosine-type recombinase/integrase [Aliiglaciecola sp. 3_MG-2023]MDO6693564.1 tyrosine-type recombinase/integrase [Aliiglaciecola sp. 3_MG-2023]
MTVKISKGGYVMDFTLNGVRYRESIPAPHNKSAEKRLIEQEAVYKMAISISDKTALDKYPNSGILQKAFDFKSASYTVDAYSSIWFGRHQANWSHTTIRGYSQKYNTHIKPNFGQIKLQDFTPSIYHDWAKVQKMSGKSMNEIRNILNQIFEEAFLDEIVDVNPIKRTRRAKVQQKEPEPFNQQEIDKILSALESPYKAYFQVAFYTGMRTGELLALRWEDIDFDNTKIHVRKSISHGVEKDPKTRGSIRDMDMHPKAQEALKLQLTSKHTNAERVFVDPRTSKTFKNAEGLRKYIWKTALNTSQVKYRCPYQTRHTYASMMLSKGKPPMWVAAQMGHADWGMIRKVYGRWINN